MFLLSLVVYFYEKHFQTYTTLTHIYNKVCKNDYLHIFYDCPHMQILITI